MRPLCSESIQCDWESTYILRDIKINNRVVYETRNNIIIQYNSGIWYINIDVHKQLSTVSSSLYLPNNSFWSYSLDNSIQFQLQIQIVPLPTINTTGMLFIYLCFIFCIYSTI